MLKSFFVVALISMGLATTAHAQVKVRTRLDHLSGTPYVVVISDINSEITSITCETWTMLGLKSYDDQNNFSIPAAPDHGVSIAVIVTNHFDGYCKDKGSIIAHTDDGDFTGTLDRGPGNWTDSTKLTFTKQQ